MFKEQANGVQEHLERDLQGLDQKLGELVPANFDESVDTIKAHARKAEHELKVNSGLKDGESFADAVHGAAHR